MDFNRLIGKGKKLVEDRGGTEALKQDAQELADVAKGDGSLTDKGKAAAAAIREPGAPTDAQKPPTT